MDPKPMDLTYPPVPIEWLKTVYENQAKQPAKYDALNGVYDAKPNWFYQP